MIPGLDENALLSNPILSTLPMHVFLHDFEAERVYGSQTRTVAGDRPQVLRVLFQSETSSINKLRDAGELMEAMRGILEGYRRLYEVATTLHRDICPENLMFYKEAGNIFGVLMKFDSDTPHPAVQQGPGKGPFMSRDLLVADTGRAIRHFYRHDLESLMYVIAFLACQIHGSSMERWKSLDMTDLLLQKIHVLNEGFPPLKDNFKAFTKALVHCSILRDAWWGYYV
ncbi:hypothetical protein C8R43DRAFT_997178 [Mycena crocata]|nr:hypothetical protein C8R43DRAFT_997178 [Mycena crocata]